jgi:hypothetical protein
MDNESLTDMPPIILMFRAGKKRGNRLKFASVFLHSAGRLSTDRRATHVADTRRTARDNRPIPPLIAVVRWRPARRSRKRREIRLSVRAVARKLLPLSTTTPPRSQGPSLASFCSHHHTARRAVRQWHGRIP